MNTDTLVRWGRAAGHRVQHAWRGTGQYVYPVCWDVIARDRGTIAYDSDAARCERCAARMARGAA